MARSVKAVLLLILSFSLPFSASATDDPVDDPVAKFERLIGEAQNATNTSTPVYLNEHRQAWAKRRFLATDIKYDVKKTDSLVSPLVGLVTFQLVIQQTDLRPTREEAEASSAFDPKTLSSWRISLTYSYRDKAWSFSKGSYESLTDINILKGHVYELSEEKIRDEPTSIPFAAILYWLPK